MAPDTDNLIVERPEGLYCPPGDFHIDPWRAVDRAVITHAHADHARAGHGMCSPSPPASAVLRARLGRLSLQGLAYGEAVELDGVRISLHPAGHVLGSAQVRIEHRGRVWVVSGDYYLSDHDESNATCAPFEPLRCDCFVTEIDLWLAVLPLAAAAGDPGADQRLVARQRPRTAAPACWSPTASARHSACWRVSTPASVRSSCIAAWMP